MSDTIDSAKGRQVSSRQWAAIIAVIVLVIAALFASGAKAAFATSEPPSTQTTEHLPTQTIDCTAISADYHRPLQNGDHINVEIKQSNGSVGQVNAYVDQNIAGGASYNGQNNLGLRIKILGQEVDPIPLTLDQIMSGIITFNYAAYLKDRGVTQWTVTFVQTNSNDSWPNTECGETPPKPTPTPTHTETPKPTPTPTETPKPEPTPTETPKPSPTPTHTVTPTPKPTETPSPTPTHTVTPTPKPTETPKPTPEPTHTPKPTPTTSPSPEPTKTPSPEPSHTAGPSPEPSSSPSASAAPPVAPKPPSKGGGLAVTGAQVAGASGMGLAAILLAAGGVIWLFRRRRANTSK